MIDLGLKSAQFLIHFCRRRFAPRTGGGDCILGFPFRFRFVRKKVEFHGDETLVIFEWEWLDTVVVEMHERLSAPARIQLDAEARGYIVKHQFSLRGDAPDHSFTQCDFFPSMN